MSEDPEFSGSSEERPKLDTRIIGKFILWAVIAAVGWSFYSTMRSETINAVQDEQIKNLQRQIKIDARLARIEMRLSIPSEPSTPGQ